MKKIIRRFVTAVLVLSLVFGCAGCGEKSSGNPVIDAAQSAGNYLYKLGGTEYGCQWLATAYGGWELSRKDGWQEEYYKSVSEKVIENNGIFDARKYTEQSSNIIALTAAGYDAGDVEGYDLTLPLADYEAVLVQGLSGAVWALLALDCGNYEIPEDPNVEVQATREMYVDYLLSRQLQDGGFAFSGEKSDTDMTAMVLQALAPYRERADVQTAVDMGLECLAGLQNDDGGFSSYGAACTESCAQVIIALTRLGILIDDERFAKSEGSNVLDKMLTYQKKDGSFAHVDGGESDAMATEQGLLALVSYLRQTAGMSDIYTIG